jgi:rhodanese-related sulfurtransferase
MQPSVPVSNPPPAVAAPIPTVQRTPPAAANPAPILWDQAKSLVAAGQAVLVDVRHPSVFAAGHIPGAMSLPETSSPEQFTAFLKNYPTNLMLIVYCSSISCSQSARVATNLVTQYRWPSVKYMTGGYLEYQQDQARNPSGTTP